MLNIQKSSLILILIIVVLIAGFVSLVTLGYTPGSVWHKAEDVKAGTFGNSVGGGNYNFPGNVGIKTPSPSSTLDVTGNIYATGQVTAGTKFHVGSSDLSSSELKVNNNSLVVTTTGNVGIGTTNPGAKLDVSGNVNVSGNIVAARPTTPDQLATKGYVDEVVALVEGIVTGAQPLVNGAHTHNDCINAGGEVVDTDVELKQCKFNASECPSGWTHYKGYAATAPRTCIPYKPEVYDPVLYGCTTPSRSFGDGTRVVCNVCYRTDPPECGPHQPMTVWLESCCYCKSNCTAGGTTITRDTWCWATVTQIGCY